jgi:beta-phosphoglucomutase family hydrolase
LNWNALANVGFLVLYGDFVKKAVIFDMDGVIVESEDAHIKAEKQIMLERGVNVSGDELHEYTGSTARFMFTKLREKYKLKDSVETLEMEKEEILLKLIRNDIEPVAGVLVLIKRLNLRHIRLAVASGSSKQVVNYLLEKMKVASLFDAIVGAEDVQRSKPAPEIFLTAAQRLNVRPEECVVIEDANLGVEAAKKAGMKCVGYKNLHSGNQDLSEADFIIDSFQELNIDRLLC